MAVSDGVGTQLSLSNLTTAGHVTLSNISGTGTLQPGEYRLCSGKISVVKCEIYSTDTVTHIIRMLEAGTKHWQNITYCIYSNSLGSFQVPL